jgi:D-3-phosphoglycerate dehydrogenase
MKAKIICITPLDHIPAVLNRLQQICDVTYLPNISKSELRNQLLSEGFSAIFTNPNKQNFKLDHDLLVGTKVKLINTASTGTNHIEINDCKKLSIEIYSLTKDYELIRQLPSTAELAFGLALSLMRKIPQSFDDVKRGNWNYEPFVGRQLAGLTAGIIGYGRLGTFMAKYCHAFGMKVLVNDPMKNVFDYDQVSKEKIYSDCDLISLHVHVQNDTIEMIDEKAIKYMVKKPFIVNTSRGEIVNENHIVSAIKSKKISGYGTDVIVDEFSTTVENSQLIKLSKEGYNVIVTPHIGGMSIEGQEKAYLYAVEKFNKLEGKHGN